MGTSWSSEKASTQLWFSPTSGTAQIMPSTWRESSFWKTEVTSLESKRGCSFKEERVAQGFGGAGDPVEGAAGADEFGPGGDHAQGIGALADEAAGQGAGLVAELVDDVLDAFSGFWGEASGRSLMTRETVWVETPAAEATSLMVGRRERWGGQIYATI